MPEQVCADLVEAAKYIEKYQTRAIDDYEFSPFSINIKPKQSGPSPARDVAFQRIKAFAEGVRVTGDHLEI